MARRRRNRSLKLNNLKFAFEMGRVERRLSGAASIWKMSEEDVVSFLAFTQLVTANK